MEKIPDILPNTSNGSASTKEILAKYSAKLESEIYSSSAQASSQDYSQFKQDMMKENSTYEKWAKSLGNLISLKSSPADTIKIQKYLDEAHLDLKANQAITLSILSLLFTILITVMTVSAVYLLVPDVSTANLLLLAFLGILTSVFLLYYTYTLPKRLANSWKLSASSQMVPALLYVVVYMKTNSNLERAIEFASQHLEGPLALDFKKVFYDVEISKYSSIKQSLDAYLDTWREYAPEFVESFHLVESSLYEPSETRRVQILEKALQVILDGVYEKMLKYSREIRSPLTSVYMLGIILPTLGLALLPLASAMLGGLVQWYHILIIFNILIPFFVFYMTSEILLKRPGGYGESSILELNPNYYKYSSKKPWIIAGCISFPLFILGLMPFIFKSKTITALLNLKQDYSFSELGLSFLGSGNIFDFKILADKTVGPFSTFSVVLSILLPLSIALFFILAYHLKTRELIKSRENTKVLEEEFNNSLFQLGNRLSDGMPAEVAFGRVAESTKGQITQNFFALVNQNIQQLGMSLERAIFDKKRGAIIYYPSALISTSMKILIESVKKGLEVAARSLMSISDYVKNVQKINQRVRDLLAEVISDMKSNMTFLAPLLAGVVVGLGTMITIILNKLNEIQSSFGSESSGLLSITNIVDLFNVSQLIPPYFLQISVGVYIVEVIFILTAAIVTVDSGKDTLKEKNELSRNLKIGLILYSITALISIIGLTLVASLALSGIGR